jgi:hypothetical protein
VSDDAVFVRGVAPGSIRAVRSGHGANCSSIGSVIDTLFVSAVIGCAVLAAVMAAMKKETITVVPPRAEQEAGGEPDAIDDDSSENRS